MEFQASEHDPVNITAYGEIENKMADKTQFKEICNGHYL